MMISPEAYLEQMKDATYEQLIKERDGLIRYVRRYEKTEKAGQYAYRDRRVKKREFRGLWIVRINAAVRSNGLTYSQFMNGLKKAGVALDRKVLAEMAYAGDENFAKLVEVAKRFIGAESK